MNIGSLNKRVDILKFNEERDEYGGIEGKWEVIKTVWARIEPINGSEAFEEQQVRAINSVKFVIRFLDGLNEKNRLRYKNTIYEIESVIDVMLKHEQMAIVGKEVKDGV